jgi:hypothetical protein
MTGRAAASRIRASMSSDCSNGSRDADIANASGQPGRIGSGTSILASSSDASTAFVHDRARHRSTDRAGHDIDSDGEIRADRCR